MKEATRARVDWAGVEVAAGPEIARNGGAAGSAEAGSPAPRLQFLEIPGRGDRMVVLAEREYELLASAARQARKLHARHDAISHGVPDTVLKEIRDGNPPVRVLRAWRGMTAVELARMVGITPSMLCQMEKTGRCGSVDTLYRLSSILDVPMELIVNPK